jgi:hypothetical protein
MDDLYHLSTTLINNMDLCPKRAIRSYDRRNLLGDDNEGTNPTRFGTVVHSTLEETHKRMIEHAITDTTDVAKLGGELFDEYWSRGTCYDFDYYQLGRDKIGEFVSRSIFNRRGRTIATEFFFILDLVSNRYWIDPIDPIAICEKIRAMGGVPVMSKIDRVDCVIEDLEYEVHDYKTNFLPFTRYEIENSKQLGIYVLLIMAMHPGAKVVAVYDMVRHGRFPVEFPAVWLEDLRSYLIGLYRQLEFMQEPEERLNKYCNWCEIRGDCATYQAALKSELPPVLTENTNLDDRWAELTTLQDRAKAIDNRITELKEMFSAKLITDNNGSPIVIGDREVYLQLNSRSEYDTKGVIETFQKYKCLTLLNDVGSIRKQAMDKVLRSRPELKAATDEFITLKYNKPSLKSRALKAGTTEEPKTDE